MKEMWRFLIARDTMHHQQWLAVIEELGGHHGVLPVPNSFDQANEDNQHNYSFFDTGLKGSEAPAGRWTSGPSLDGKGNYRVFKNLPMGQAPDVGPARPDSAAETQQIA